MWWGWRIFANNGSLFSYNAAILPPFLARNIKVTRVCPVRVFVCGAHVTLPPRPRCIENRCPTLYETSRYDFDSDLSQVFWLGHSFDLREGLSIIGRRTVPRQTRRSRTQNEAESSPSEAVGETSWEKQKNGETSCLFSSLVAGERRRNGTFMISVRRVPSRKWKG